MLSCISLPKNNKCLSCSGPSAFRPADLFALSPLLPKSRGLSTVGGPFYMVGFKFVFFCFRDFYPLSPYSSTLQIPVVPYPRVVPNQSFRQVSQSGGSVSLPLYQKSMSPGPLLVFFPLRIGPQKTPLFSQPRNFSPAPTPPLYEGTSSIGPAGGSVECPLILCDFRNFRSPLPPRRPKALQPGLRLSCSMPQDSLIYVVPVPLSIQPFLSLSPGQDIRSLLNSSSVIL